MIIGIGSEPFEHNKFRLCVAEGKNHPAAIYNAKDRKEGKLPPGLYIKPGNLWNYKITKHWIPNKKYRWNKFISSKKRVAYSYLISSVASR